MSFIREGLTFGATQVFTHAELEVVTPKKILEYLLIKVYENPAANPDIDPPKFYRTNTIKAWKKAWSYYMLNKNIPWNEISRTGNPTRCIQITQLIKSMKKMEVARRGVSSKARRAFVAQEYEQIIELSSKFQNKEMATLLPAYNCFQYNTIGRVDDTAKFCCPDLASF